jgi:cell division protein FtsL
MVMGTQKLKWAISVVVVLSIIAVVWIFYQYRLDRAELKMPLPPKASTKALMALSQVH